MASETPTEQQPVWLADLLDRFVIRTGQIISGLLVLLMAAILIQIILRKGFAQGWIALEELQWHLYAICLMFGIAYAQSRDAHVRVDILRDRLNANTRRLIEIFGLIGLILPFIGIVFYHSLDFVEAAWRIGERSSAPGGLPYRWVVKAIIPASFALWFVAVLARIIRDITLFKRNRA